MTKRKKKRNILLLALAVLLLAGAAAWALPIPPAGAVKVPILMYHSVTDDPAKAGKYTVTAAEFEADMQWLSDNGYTTVFLSQLSDYEETGAPLPEKPVVVTLDDGYENNLTLVLPILEKLDLRATVSVVGSFSLDTADTRCHLDLADVKTLADSGRVEIGSHTYAMHENKAGGRRGCRRMSGESAADYKAALTADLTENQTLLTENCGVTPTVFTYPYGFVSPAARKVVKALGFKVSLTVFPGLNYLTGNPDELYGLRRFNRPSGVKTAAFMKRLDCPAAAWFSW